MPQGCVSHKPGVRQECVSDAKKFWPVLVRFGILMLFDAF
jgi:hypothetical protein